MFGNDHFAESPDDRQNLGECIAFRKPLEIGVCCTGSPCGELDFVGLTDIEP